MISWEQIKKISRQQNIDNITILREYLEVIFLSVLYQEKSSENVYFKGGTAIRLLFDGTRFSQDLDFTTKLTKKESAKLMAAALKKANQTIEPDLELINQEKKNQSFRRRLVYKSPKLPQKITVAVEYSLREKPLAEDNTILRSRFPTPFQPVIKHLAWPEILAEKIRALMTRSREQGRDLYDLWFLLSKNVDLNWSMVNKKMAFYEIETNIAELREKIHSFSEKKLVDDLGKFLPKTERESIPDKLKELTLKELERRGEL